MTWPELFASAERAASRGALHEAQALLDEARAAADTARATDDEQLPLLQALAATAQALGRTDVADGWFQRLFAASHESLEAADPELGAAATALALNRAAFDLDAAVSFSKGFVDAQRAALGREHPEVSRALVRFAELTARTGRHDEARALAAEALTTAAPGDAAFCRYLAGLIEAQAGAWPQAEQALRAALAEAAPDPGLATTIGLELGDVLAQLGRVDEAIAALQAAGKVAGSLSAARGREARGRLAALYVQHGRAAEAVPLLKENVFQLEDQLGPASLALGMALLDLAAAAARADRRAPPHDLYIRARQVLEVVVGPSALPVADALLAHASLYLDAAADLDTGAALVHRALEIIGTQVGHTHPAVAEPLTWLAAFRWLKADPERAAALGQKALELLGASQAKDLSLEHHARALAAATALAGRDGAAAVDSLRGPR